MASLCVHTRDGVIEIPLTGDPEHDALLERLVRRGHHAVTKDGTLLAPVQDDSDAAARGAMREEG